MSSTRNEASGGPASKVDDPKNQGFISLAQLLRETTVETKTATIDEDRQETSEQTIKERETVRIGQQKYFDLRDKWSWFIFVFIGFMLVFQLLLTMAIGFKWADFSHYTLFLNLVIGENFAQIIGMGFIVAKYLFPNGKS